MQNNGTRNLLIGLPTIGGVILIWEIASRSGWVDTILLPPPTRIAQELISILSTSSIYMDLGVTVLRFLWGYIIGCSIAIPLGVILGVWRSAYAALELLLESLRPIPASALLPVALLLFGLGNFMTISIIAYAVVWPVLINTIDGIKSIDPVLIDTGRIFGLGSREIIRKILIPAALPSIVTGMRISLALSITLVIVVEMIVGNQGLGHRIIDAERTFRFAEMYGLIFIIGVLGYSTNLAFSRLSYSFVAWHREVNQSRGL